MAYYWKIRISLALNFVVFAILLNTVGIVIKRVIDDYGVNEATAASLEAFKDLSIAAASFVLASYIPRIGYLRSMLAGLLAVTLASGASPSSALTAVAAAVEGPIAAELRSAVHGLRLGRDPARVWRELSSRPGMAALGRAMARAVETGASVSDALHRLAEDLHASARLEGERKARTVGVRAAAPLGLCLLPAFVLLGVVPLVASTVSALLVP